MVIVVWVWDVWFEVGWWRVGLARMRNKGLEGGEEMIVERRMIEIS